MVNIVYPTLPDGVDYQGIMGATTRGYNAGKDWRDEKNANAAFGQYINSVGGQQAPQSLSSLGSLMSPQQPNTVQRAPLAAPMDPATARVDQAFAAQGQGRQQPLSSNQIAGRFLKTVRDGGVTNPYALAAIASTGAHESGFSPKNATGTWSDPSQSGQAGTAGGIMSWRGPRLQALQRFAQQNGDDPNAPSPETQGKFLLAEDPSLIQKLQSAQSPQEAQQIMNNAWRFAGYDQQGGEAAARLQSAEAYAPQFGGQDQSPSQQALEGLAVGQTAPGGQPSQVADASGSFMPQGQPQAAPQAQQPASILPPPEVMQALFKAPGTRPLAIALAQSAIKMRANANDPQAQIEYQTAVEKLRQLRDPQSKLINAGGGSIYNPNTGEWITQPGGGKTAETGLVPQMMRNPKTGETIYVQPTKDGRLLKSQVPDGFQPYDPLEKSRLTAQGTQEGKTLGARNQAEASMGSATSSLDRLGQSAKEIMDDPALSRITGVMGMIPNYPGSEASSVQARLNTLKSQIGFTVLQAMRDASKTGGALGQVSDKENELLQNNLAALDQAQSEEDLKRELGKIVDYVQGAKQRMQSAFDQTYGGQQAAPTGNRTSSGVQWSIEE